MKKQKIPILVLTTCIFAAFVFGFFAGRNLNRTPVQIRTISPVRETTEPPAGESTSPSGAAQASSESTAETTPGNSESAGSPFPININTAASPQLENLPGIGPVIAQRIVDYRNANGPFSSPGQLINVSGIGEKRLAAIWDYITIGD